MDFDFTLPGLGRPKSTRPERVAEAIKNELSILLVQKIGDPRLANVAISRVVATPDLKQAKIYFTLPAGSESGPAIKGMNRAKGFFRSHMAKVLNLRHTPELLFFYDRRNDDIEKIDALFREIEKEKKND